jgi:shikimate dehydrogenase
MLVDINKNTELILSIAKIKGSTGVVVQNFLYNKYDANCIYKPLDIDDNHSCSDIVKAIKVFKIKAAAISMPYKTEIAGMLDLLDDTAVMTRNVNTVVRNENILKGYNTDYFGILKLFERQKNINSAIIYGCGSVARTVVISLKKIGCKNISIVARNASKKKKFETWVENTGLVVCPRELVCYDLIVNCTPVGMNNEKTIVSYRTIQKSKIVFDVVTNNTNLMKIAKKEDKICLYGRDMAIWQSLKQFNLYTGKEINYEKEFKEIKEVIKGNTS